MYLKYIFKIKDRNLVSDYESLVRNLTINLQKLVIKDRTALIGDKQLPITIYYRGENENFPTGIVKVESDSVEGLELFDKTIKEIVGNESRFGKFTCIYDGISTYYSTEIYSELHEIERRTQEFLREAFFLSDKSGESKEYQATIKKMDSSDFSFSKLINEIFKASDITDTFIDHVRACVEFGTVPNGDLLPKSFWDSLDNSLLDDKEQGLEINNLLNEIRSTRNTIAHCKEFKKKDYINCIEQVKKLKQALDKIIASIESTDISKMSREVSRINNSLQADNDYIKQKYFIEYDIFEKDILARTGLLEIDWENVSDDIEPLKIHRNFYESISEKTDSEVIEEIKNLEDINFTDEKGNDLDDLTIIVPAQDEGFKRVFLGQREWYDIRIGKSKRNRIKYIAGYEVAPESGVKYWAEVDKIVPSDNYVGYWKVIFKGEVKEYSEYKKLGNTWPPQNSRYVSKKALDEAKYLSDVF
ncbi:TPA: hypothetical protein ACGQEN_001620 [Streptococcus pyogenes]|uniref:hypothetical protein n=1 Tax=Streptococcus pyogenes TaxID=1314 RepID=UPI000DA38795|nr:hypothetical protein [Streptococcus pyogenes]SQG27421.1 Uncharacterised protein [Streptococcus pyogenes]VGU12801.1 Uncharacterised protein [Streptococcus pyogenes]VGU35170.1 Uncharacterised protein [Streptococcus pyogenes]HEQ9660479.1 hypothetical protein [Streptococcus pyogenes]HES8063772.1 hypothetical protein [Streptococcus pyogenes]